MFTIFTAPTLKKASFISSHAEKAGKENIFICWDLYIVGSVR